MKHQSGFSQIFYTLVISSFFVALLAGVYFYQQAKINYLTSTTRIASCINSPQPTSVPTPTPTLPVVPLETKTTLKPADSKTPASGVCATNTNNVVNIDIYVDAAVPRCVEVNGNQKLKITNNHTKPIDVKLSNFSATIKPTNSYTFNTVFGSYLSPGVHFINVTGGPSAELWLQ